MLLNWEGVGDDLQKLLEKVVLGKSFTLEVIPAT